MKDTSFDTSSEIILAVTIGVLAEVISKVTGMPFFAAFVLIPVLFVLYCMLF